MPCSSQPYSMHGGAGALISLGLLKRLVFEEMEACILRQHDSGGDAFLTTCLWEVRHTSASASLRQ